MITEQTLEISLGTALDLKMLKFHKAFDKTTETDNVEDPNIIWHATKSNKQMRNYINNSYLFIMFIKRFILDIVFINSLGYPYHHTLTVFDRHAKNTSCLVAHSKIYLTVKTWVLE